MAFIALQYLNISLEVIRYSDLCNVNVVKKLRYSRVGREHLSIRTFAFRNTINLSNSSNSNLRVKKKHLKHSSSSENQKNLPGGESNPGLPRDRRGYSPLYYRGIGCVKFKLNGFCNGETSSITLKQNNFKTLLTMKAKLTDVNFLQCGNNLPRFFRGMFIPGRRKQKRPGSRLLIQQNRWLPLNG